jgi:hypothetical protein
MSNNCVRFLIVLVAFGVAAACGDAGTRPSPAGPSALPAEPDGGLSSLGTNRHGGPHGRVGGEGTVASLTGTCPDLHMVVRGTHVTTDASTVFENGECGNLRPGTRVFVDGTVVDGSVTATLVRILDQPGGPPPTPVAGEGVVGSLKGTCPTLTMVVHGYPVMTTSTTMFLPNNPASCNDITPGTRIRVAGTIAGNSVLADEVEILAPPAP